MIAMIDHKKKKWLAMWFAGLGLALICVGVYTVFISHMLSTVPITSTCTTNDTIGIRGSFIGFKYAAWPPDCGNLSNNLNTTCIDYQKAVANAIASEEGYNVSSLGNKVT